MNKRLAAIGAVVILGAIATAALSPYFTESTVDEALPEGVIVPPTIEPKDSMTEDDAMMDDTMKDDDAMMDDTMKDDDAMMDDTMKDDDAMMDDTMKDDDAMMDDTMKDNDAMVNDMVETPTSYAGTFVGVGDGIHNAEGNAYALPLEDGGNVLRMENLRATNGPDLFVYLATDKGASEFINLGALKANIGNQNYDIPEGTDLEKYNNVLIWCKAFSVLFGSAELSPQ